MLYCLWISISCVMRWLFVSLPLTRSSDSVATSFCLPFLLWHLLLRYIATPMLMVSIEIYMFRGVFINWSYIQLLINHSYLNFHNQSILLYGVYHMFLLLKLIYALWIAYIWGSIVSEGSKGVPGQGPSLMDNLEEWANALKFSSWRSSVWYSLLI